VASRTGRVDSEKPIDAWLSEERDFGLRIEPILERKKDLNLSPITTSDLSDKINLKKSLSKIEERYANRSDSQLGEEGGESQLSYLT
jgi:hypothetical protein